MYDEEESTAMGLHAQQYSDPNKGKFVDAGPSSQVHQLQPHRTSMHVFHAARQVVNMHTTSVDRATGYLITFVPISIGFAILILVVTMALWKYPFLSFAAFLIFWGTFIATWLAGLVITSLWTPEYISFYEAKQKWNTIRDEQKERWAYYRWQAGMPEEMGDGATTRRIVWAVLILLFVSWMAYLIRGQP